MDTPWPRRSSPRWLLCAWLTAGAGCAQADEVRDARATTDGASQGDSEPDDAAHNPDDDADEPMTTEDATAPDDASPDDAVVAADAAPDVQPDAAPDAAPDASGPWVRIVMPADRASVASPVAFQVAASGVATVRLFTDEFPMSAAWDPATRDNLVYRFGGADRAHAVVLRGYSAAGGEQARAAISLTVTGTGETGSGSAGPSMYNTYYYLSLQSDYAGASDTVLYDGTCMPLATVPAAWSDAVCIEGSGRLSDGRVINYSSSCTCGRHCPTGGTICYSVLDQRRYPWGEGAASRALVPLRSWATDRSVLPTGTLVYVARWDGTMIPSLDGLGGFVHDGCFRADDTGGAITGNHFDFFAGSTTMWHALERIYPTHTTFAVELGATRCAYLGR